MNRSAQFLAFIAAALGLTACSYSMGNRDIKTEERSLSGFTSINLGGSGSLVVHRGDFKVLVTSDSNLLPKLTTEVVGSELRIGVKPGASIINPTKLEYEVTLPDLSGLKISGSANVHTEAFAGSSLEVTLSGSGSLEGQLSYDQASYWLSGSGSARVKGESRSVSVSQTGSGRFSAEGKAQELKVRLSGSGDFDSRDAASERADISISGSGGARVRVASELKARLSGAGALSYWGNPTLDSSVTGSARVRKAGD